MIGALSPCRWTAHRKNEVATIPAFVTETRSDVHLLELAIQRNATHGLQLSPDDKSTMAKFLYNMTANRDRAQRKEELAKLLSVSVRTVREWLSRIDKDDKEARDRRIHSLWMACYTQAEIAELVDLTQQRVEQVLQETAGLPKLVEPAANHQTDFSVPIYNVWKFQEKTAGSRHFGNSEQTIVDNLLYLYTKPLEIVVDPFAGGGSTIDVALKRMRRHIE